MIRHQLQFLEYWMKGNTRKPLVIRGARQVGKSTLVELFADRHRMQLINVNLERHPNLSQIFAGNNPEQIIQQIEYLPGMKAVDTDSILFLDEIQAVPEAIPEYSTFIWVP